MSVHYKFKSGREAHTITFDNLHISVGELKKAIMQQRKIGKCPDLDLQITNAQTKEGMFLFYTILYLCTYLLIFISFFTY